MQRSPGDTLGAWDTCGSGSARMGQLEGARKHTAAAWAAQLGDRQAPGPTPSFSNLVFSLQPKSHQETEAQEKTGTWLKQPS